MCVFVCVSEIVRADNCARGQHMWSTHLLLPFRIYYITHSFFLVPFTDSDDTGRESEREVSQVSGLEAPPPHPLAGHGGARSVASNAS